MNKILKDALLMLVAGTFAVSCADYNETDNFTAQPDPTVTTPYNDLNPVKSYINRGAYPNMSLDAALNIKDFKEQALAHAAAVANFDRFYFGTAFMSGSIINAKGVLNFIDMKEQLDHVQEIGGWNSERRDKAILTVLNNSSVSIRQLSRLTGISKAIIERICRR